MNATITIIPGRVHTSCGSYYLLADYFFHVGTDGWLEGLVPADTGIDFSDTCWGTAGGRFYVDWFGDRP